MLGTWRLDNKNDSVFTRQAIDPVTSRPVVQQACNSCRSKKLRCTGEKTGCSRCKTLSRPCVYAHPSGKGSGRGRKSKAEAKDAKTSRNAAPGPSKQASRSPPSVETQQSPPQQSLPPPPPPPPLPRSNESLRNIPALAGPARSISCAPVEFPVGIGETTNDGEMSPHQTTFDMTDGGFDKMRSLGHSSPASIEQWLTGSPPPCLDLSAEIEYLWPGEMLDTGAFSAMTENMMPNGPLVNHMISPPSTRDGLRSSPSSSGMLPSLTDGGSTQPSSGRDSIVCPPNMGLDMAVPRGPGMLASVSGAFAGSNNSNSISNLPSPDSCQCLQRVVFLIDELESIQDVAATQLDAGLASHKEALRYGEAMLMCGYCTSRPENMTILTFLTDRLADLCERIVGGYLEQMHGDVNIGGRPVCQGDSGRRPSLAASVGSQGQGQGQGQGQNQGQNQGYHSHGVRWGVFFGDYEVDSPSEWELLVKNLIILQLHALSALMGRVKEISGAMRCDTPWRKAVGTEKRIANLSHRMGPIGQAAWSPYYGNDGGGGGGGGGGGLCT